MTDRETRLHLQRLRELEKRLDRRAEDIRQGGFNPKAEAAASDLSNEAYAIRWALREIAPLHEGPMQVLDQMAGAAE